eukprot:NODE_127_length_18646_cov_0.421632.p6 type:complete len:168 gc:universal NODE_127_length_18646_cov_0.421632:5527-6030(+)
MFSVLLLTTLFGFDLAIAQNWGADLTAGSTVTFSLYDPNGGTVPPSTEIYDVTLLDGSGDMNNAKTVATLQSGLTQTSGISVNLPGNLASGKYFFGIIAQSGSKYSGAFNVNGVSSSPSPNNTSEPNSSENSTDSTNSTSENTKNANSSSASTLMQFAILTLAVNSF